MPTSILLPKVMPNSEKAKIKVKNERRKVKKDEKMGHFMFFSHKTSNSLKYCEYFCRLNDL